MQFEITDPTMLWCSVAAILFGLFFIVIAIYKECRYTKKIKKMIEEFQEEIRKEENSLQENNCRMHEKLDRLTQTTQDVLFNTNFLMDQKYFEMEKHTSTQQELWQEEENNKMSTVDWLANIDVSIARAMETERFQREYDELQNKNKELMQLTKQQEQSMQNLKKQIDHLLILIEQKDQVISQLTQNHVRKSEEHNLGEGKMMMMKRN